jgi:hypothetical protein
MMVVRKLPGALDNRVYSIVWTWKTEADGSFTLAFADSDEAENFGDGAAKREADDVLVSNASAAKAVRGSAKGFYRVEPLALNVCRVTLVFQGIAGGSIPLMFVDMVSKQQLNVLKNLQGKYERNGEQVDAELRSSFLPPPTLEELSSEQREVVTLCRELENEFGSGESIALKSPSPFVAMWMEIVSWEKIKGKKNAERSIAVGKGRVVVDCSASSALSWTYAYCSRERQRVSLEEGNPARLVVREFTAHDNVVATIKRMPFPLSSREFVVRQICTSEDNDLLLVGSPVADKIDYGMKTKLIRGTSRSFFRFAPLSATQCEVTIYQYLDAGGIVPEKVVESKIPDALLVLDDMRNEFQRDDEIDSIERRDTALAIKEEPQDYTSDENNLFARVSSRLADLSQEDLVALDSPDPLVKMSCVFAAGASSTIVTATTTVDSTPEECAAWDILKLSREQLKRSKNSEITLDRTSSHHSIFHFVKDLGVPGFSPREWILRTVWKWEGAVKLQVAIEHFPDHPGYEKNPKYLRGTSSMVFYEYEILPLVAGVPQTRVSFTQQVDLGGMIPKWVVDRAGVRQLMYLSAMRTRFDKSSEIDATSRARIASVIENHSTAYSKEENASIHEKLAMLSLFKNTEAKDVDSPSPAIKNSIALKKGDQFATGRSETLVRASKVQILAYMLDTPARCRWSYSDVERDVLETKNDHHFVAYQCKKGSHGGLLKLRPREGVSSGIWRQEADGSFVYVGVPTEHPRKQNVPAERVRSRMSVAMTIEETSPGVCEVVYVNQLDMGGSVPIWVMNHYMKTNLTLLHKVRSYFQALRRLEHWDGDDGIAIAETMVMKSKAEKVRELTKGKRQGNSESASKIRMRRLFETHKGLKEVGVKYPFIEGMLARVVQNKLRSAEDVSSRLCNVSKREGRMMGSCLAMSLASSLTAEAAVDEWIGKYPALKELDRVEVWFRPMMDTVALRLLSEVPWGLKMRAFVGAGLSMLDMASDINIILMYTSTSGEEKFGWGLLLMICTCLVFQLFVVYVQNLNKPAKVMRMEVLIVLTGLKPGKRLFV